MNTLSSASESSNVVSALMDKLAQACTDLIDALVMTMDKVSEYWLKTVQGVVVGVKSLFVDTIIVQLNKIAALIRELKKQSSNEDIDKLIAYQKNEMMNRLSSHTFFRENFARRVNEIFA